MASYYNGNSEIQGGDGLQTLILMNPGYVNYSDGQAPPSQPGNFMFLNNNQPASLPHAPPPTTQQFVGIPLSSQPPVSIHSQHDISGIHAFMPRVHYNVYNPVEMGQDVTRFQQGLSLTLSSQQPGFSSQAARGQTVSPTAVDESRALGTGGGSTASASGITNGVSSVLLNSKYLNATHELLEEVVNVSKSVLNNSDQSTKNLKIMGDGSSPTTARSGEETSGKRDGPELTTAERQEIQMKKAKLVNMLDEVEQRYRQYHNQMQVVITWFEQAAGNGSAKTYTSLALQTISKQFRCLKDAIIGQIKTASRSLGEEEDVGGGGGKSEGGGSRLKFVDNQLRQQRALQQIGMIQHNAWRPQRGLPERSVSVLRAWLFEHFLHPYPKDSDKHMLAKQTGLTRSQVSNWFINARVRLWKPMVEEMYLEEIKEQEQGRSEEHKASKSEQSDDNPSSSKYGKSLSPQSSKRGFNPPPPPQMKVSTTVSTSPTASRVNFQNPSGFTLVNSSQMDGIAQFSPKKPRNHDNQPQQQQKPTSEVGFTLMGNPTDFMGGLGGYPIGEIGRFTAKQFQQPYSGNAVSLTLGLPHCDNLSMSGNHQNFLPNQNIQQTNEFEVMNQPSSSHSTAMYETMSIPNQKRFAAQPLPDFVA
ncbi:BEL1-like homeodomain protein 1 [Bidens hawaiensis]|uniref:BEL1-like homeodomain protein 1 n=1 Tax=Bidens hawaiensis TaxID=980011 RepID=UPI00404A1EC4